MMVVLTSASFFLFCFFWLFPIHTKIEVDSVGGALGKRSTPGGINAAVLVGRKTFPPDLLGADQAIFDMLRAKRC